MEYTSRRLPLIALRVTAFHVLLGACLTAQPRYIVGGGPGAAVLSTASGRIVSERSAAISAYAPRLGGLVHAFGGWHLSEYLSVQGAWSANRNRIAFFASSAEGFYEQQRSSSQHNFGADALLYFRNRRSTVRPYLSAGLNVMRFRSNVKELSFSGQAAGIPGNFRSTEPGLRVATGADVILRNGWGFRYAFLENLQRNVIGRSLSPPAKAPLMTFQHLFGFSRSF